MKKQKQEKLNKDKTMSEEVKKIDTETKKTSEITLTGLNDFFA